MRVPHTRPHWADGVRTTVDIAARPETVFHAISDPLELAAWLGGNSTSAAAPVTRAWAAATVPVAGQPWRAPALGPDGAAGSVCGEYLRVDPPRVLESTWRASWDDFAPDRVRFELAPIEIGGQSGTRLTVTHTRAHAHLQVTAAVGIAESSEWRSILSRLAAWVATPVAALPPGELRHPTGAVWYGDTVAFRPRG